MVRKFPIDWLNAMVDCGVLEHDHDALERGYFRRTIHPEVEPYHGRFGHGYKVHSATWRTTMYHVISYYTWAKPEYEAYRELFERGMSGVA